MWYILNVCMHVRTCVCTYVRMYKFPLGGRAYLKIRALVLS